MRDTGITNRLLFLVLIFINVNFALDFPLTKVALEHLQPIGLLFWRWLFSVLFFVPVAIFLGAGGDGGRLSGSKWKLVSLVLLAGIVAQTGATIVMNVGLTLTLASNLSVLFLTVPVFTSLMAAVLLREKLYANRIVGLVLALLGTALLSEIDWQGTAIGGRYLTGNLLILVACMGFALGVILTKKLLEQMNYLQVNAFVFTVALIGVVPFAYSENPHFISDALQLQGWLWLILIKIGTLWAAAALAFTWVLSKLEASQTSVSLYLTPVFGVVLSSLMLDEEITISMVVGGGFAIIGLAVVIYEDRLRRKGWLSISESVDPAVSSRERK